MLRYIFIACFLCLALVSHPGDLRSCAGCCGDLIQQVEQQADGCCAKTTPEVHLGDVACDCGDPGVWLAMPVSGVDLPTVAVVEHALHRVYQPVLTKIRHCAPSGGHDPPQVPYLRSTQLLI